MYQLRDFALLLDGFPADAIDEEEIANFFCHSILPNQPSESVVKVVIGFDARHYDEHVKLRESLKERLDILKVGIHAPSVSMHLTRCSNMHMRSTASSGGVTVDDLTC